MAFIMPSLMASCLSLSVAGLKVTEVPSCEDPPQPAVNTVGPTMTAIRKKTDARPALLCKVQSFPWDTRPTSPAAREIKNDGTNSE